MTYINETILKNEPKATSIETKVYENGDLDIMFKVGRKKHTVKMTHLEFETRTADVNEEYSPMLKEYNEKIKKATDEIQKEYEEEIKAYNTKMSAVGETYTVQSINDYFNELK